MMVKLILALAGLAMASEMPEILRNEGITQTEFQQLKGRKLLSENFGSPELQCSEGDKLGFQEKAVLADAIIMGKIIKVEYLYKEGGPFRTLFTMQVEEVLRGNISAREIQILERGGPIVRDHSRWRRGSDGIQLEKGDAGFFLLDKEYLAKLARKFPEHSDFLAGRFTLFNGSRGIYLTKDGDVDPRFLEDSEKSQRNLKAAEIRESVTAINAILRQGK